MVFPLLLALAFSEITPSTVSGLHLAWTAHTRSTPPNRAAASKAAFEATPVLHGDLLYVITPFDQVLALNPGTGAEVWRYDPVVSKNLDYSEVTSRGVAVAGSRLFFGTIDARLIALDARTGKLLWETNRRIETSTPVDGNYQITSAPAVIGSTVVVGSAIGDNGRAKMQRGAICGYAASTGRLRWCWDPTPPGTTGAAN